MGAPIARPRVVDDTDPAVQYGPGGWFVADPKTFNVGNFAPIFQGTSHATTNDSSLSFTFNGISIRVLGTIMVSTVNNVTDPTWDCFVDGQSESCLFVSRGQLALMQRARASLWLGCFVKYLDHLVYTPPPDEIFETAVLTYSNTDPERCQLWSRLDYICWSTAGRG
ncbi:hypothetical protein C8R47DRAFT_1248456 [Mycena vitilis]|nr:hypothetical protein C8R47DRAFT_1248456 [Mycena vitilis]